MDWKQLLHGEHKAGPAAEKLRSYRPQYSYPYSSISDYVRLEPCWDSVAMIMWGKVLVRWERRITPKLTEKTRVWWSWIDMDEGQAESSTRESSEADRPRVKVSCKREGWLAWRGVGSCWLSRAEEKEFHSSERASERSQKIVPPERSARQSKLVIWGVGIGYGDNPRPTIEAADTMVVKVKSKRRRCDHRIISLLRLHLFRSLPPSTQTELDGDDGNNATFCILPWATLGNSAKTGRLGVGFLGIDFGRQRFGLETRYTALYETGGGPLKLHAL
ncbi:hypothetical protein B0H16DRAFT_1467118 [Mycena metata]|uniref:Uncharacterized protein n=1 Tax=Mycena metata TaxID=1033252 RepID=A0AAD7MWN5_9AGAR|nr:hypothetical protein B0H16DRAFT_1467118 [Mycena metata]